MLKAREQRPGEPDKWYGRFQAYCALGSSRSLLKCYQLVMAEQDALQQAKQGGNGQHALRCNSGQGKAAPKRTHTPATWRKYAKAYDWAGRAKDFDEEQRELAVKRMDETLLKVSYDLEEVRLFYLNLMRGWIRSPDGEMAPVRDIYQRRMAAKALQNLAGMMRTLLAEGEEVEAGEEIEIKEILAHEPVEKPDERQDGEQRADDGESR